MATSIKISQLPAKGSNLEATDLLEVSEFNGTGYVSKSITGAEIVASVPPTSVEWGDIGGTLSSQTDLNTALNGKVPTTRTLTINGTTQDLSADRTFTISTGITIGTTAITSGTVGRVLFEGTGNVVQESANLFWDNTNGRLGIGTSSPAHPLHIVTSGLVTGLFVNTGNDGGFTSQNNGTLALNRTSQIRLVNGSTIFGANDRTYQLVNLGKSGTTADFLLQYWDGSTYNERFRVFSTGNFAINTNTDAGFKLDVNGTARFQSTVLIKNAYVSGGAVTSFSATFNDDSNGIQVLQGAIKRVALGNSGGDILLQGPMSSNISGTTRAYGLDSFGFRVQGNGQTSFRDDITNAFVNSSALVEMVSTSRGFLPPRMTQAQRNAIASPAIGLEIYQTDATEGKYIYKSSGWTYIG